MKTVLITGCSSGFGAAAADRFASAGWNVVATMRRPEHSPKFKTGVTIDRLDVQDLQSIKSAIRRAILRFGAIDAVVNNAGFGLYGPFESASREKVIEQFDVNVFGLMDVIRAILPHFRERRSGHIVNVTSGAGVFGTPLLSLYTASKFAVEGFSESLFHEIRPFGIRVKIVEPGGVTSTNFVARSGVEAGAVASMPDYEPVVVAAARVFAAIAASRSGGRSDQVADVIFEAANDQSDRLRWVATEGIKAWFKARRESSEEEYMALMRREVGLIDG